MEVELSYVAVGFAAQMVDGALGMAYGATASSLLASLGLPLATTSATVHAAECFTTGLSGIMHHAFGNVDRDLFKRLLLPGIIGAIIGAYVLVNAPGDFIRPFVSAYLCLIGIIIIFKAFGDLPGELVRTHLASLGFFGAFLDAIGGGGWGPIVTSTLLARGNDVRITVGSVNAVEFFITIAASLTFILTIGLTHLNIIVSLAIGGVFAAPLAAWSCKIVPRRPLAFMVGILVIGLSLRNLWLWYGR